MNLAAVLNLHAPRVRFTSVQINGSIINVQLPTVVEVEVVSRCNRRCSYCPVSVNPKPDSMTHMPDAVFEKLLSELATMQFSGRFSYHLYSEPLLRRDLVRLVRRTATLLPEASQILYTNGDLLDDARYRALIEGGISAFIVTRHDRDVDGVPERRNQVVLVPDDLIITNRGGLLFESEETVCLPCFAPSEMLIVTVRGDVLLCYEDANRQNVLGNIMAEDLTTIWTRTQTMELRKALRTNRQEGTPEICRKCSNRAHATPGTSWFAL